MLGLCTLFTSLSTTLLAQSTDGQIRGYVRVRDSGINVAGATIEIEGTDISGRTDSSGHYRLEHVSPGPHVMVVRRLGFAPSRLRFVMPDSGPHILNVQLATNPLQLDQLIVTADRTGRAAGELGTASVINRDAIANQIASSLQGILELVPGTTLQPPGLDAAAPFSLRALASSTTGLGPSAYDIASSGTLIILDGVPLSNNANLQSVGARGEIVPPASTAGSGIDLRRIPAATLERVEVIRGIPSARWGDLTQGAIIVDTRAAETAPEFAARLDPRTNEGNAVGGRSFVSKRQAVTLATNLAETRGARTLSSNTTRRVAAQLAHRISFGEAPTSRSDNGDRAPHLMLDTRADWYQLRFDAPERADLEIGRSSFQNDYGVRLAERARFRTGRGALEWTAAYDAQSQRTQETRRLVRPSSPFTDRLSEGRSIGSYAEGVYIGAYTLEGAPRLLYSRLEWERRQTDGFRDRISQLRLGAELRREWNDGAGYAFAIDKPPQVSSFNGVRGYDRPRRFDVSPPLVTSAAYADALFTLRRWGIVAEAQPGLRLSVLHDGSWWTSGSRTAMLEPRFTASITPRSWLRINGGIGSVSKLPTVAQLYPAVQYFDLVNVNRFTPDPRERLAVLTTFIRDPQNTSLAMSRGAKREIGVELDGGARRGSVSAVYFDDRIIGAVTIRRDLSVLGRDRYALADTARGSGQPGRILDPPIGTDNIPIFLDRYVNGGRVENRGVEFTVILPVIPMLQTRLELSGASIRSTFATDDRNFGGDVTTTAFQVDTSFSRLAYFDAGRGRSRRSVLTWRLVHHEPELGFVLTATVQQRFGERLEALGPRDSVSFVGYVTRNGELIPVPREERFEPQYADLRSARAGTPVLVTRIPGEVLVALQVAKSLGRSSRLSFYAFNAFDRIASFGAGGGRPSPPTRFGAELTLPTAGLFRTNR